MVAIKQKFHRLPDGSVDVAIWLQHIKEKQSPSNIEHISKAVSLIQRTSQKSTTFYGQPSLEQGLEMAEIILDLKLGQDAAAASIISREINNTQLTIDTIQKEFNESIAKLVNDINQISIFNALQTTMNKARDLIQIDRLRKTFLAMVSDIRVVLIKLAERLCIMRGIKNINIHERKKLAQETLDIYAPLANRLGIGQLKWELEDVSFRYTDPDTYKKIAAFLVERRIDREAHLQNALLLLKNQFTKAKIQATISGRVKHIYSIYLKAQKKNLAYESIFDYNALRILVSTTQDCYTVLSIINTMWESVREEFSDYIARPKPNGYRSIHTAVRDTSGKHLEIQIRTYEMHDEAEHGISAHWLYKEDKLAYGGYEEKIIFLRQLLEWHKEVARHNHQSDKAFQDVLEDRIYVFTPTNDIVDLPLNATPIDFAYHIHSGLGHRCRGAKVNGHIVPLTYALRTGDQVSIITVKNGTPSRDWLRKEEGYIKTARARSKILQFFKQQDSEHAAAQNSFKAAHAAPTVQRQMRSDTVNKSAISMPVSAETTSAARFQIWGVSDLLTRIAQCCKPTSADHVIGYITRGRGISVHKQNCSMLAHLTLEKQDRFIEVKWAVR